MSRDSMPPLGAKIRVKVGDSVRYRNGDFGKVLTTNAKTTSQSPATFPIYTQHVETNIVYAHREDGSLGLSDPNPHDIVIEPQEVDIFVRLYRGTQGELHSICSPQGYPEAPMPHIGEGKVRISLAQDGKS